MAEVRTQSIVEYRKSITVDDPDAYAEVALKFEGLTEKGVEELRQLFNKFYAEIETIVHGDIIILPGNAPEELADPEMDQPRTVLTYKKGRPYFEQE